VVERQRLMALAKEQANSLKALTGKGYALAAGKLLEADTVLMGRLFLVQDKLTASLQAIDIPTDRVAAADQMSFRPVDMMETALERVRAPGTLDVWCRQSSRFRVDVDGRFGRLGPGLVGPLPVGKRQLTFMPVHPDSPYGTWSTTATVRSGKTVTVEGRLPWREGSPWASWVSTGVAPEYAGHDVRLYYRDGAPAVQADKDAIRLAWARRGDLWGSVSTDGETFTPPARLDLPVSSGWLEQEPKLLRDERGRLMLFFLSDRDAQHRALPYVCWSRDFRHWTAPALVMDESVTLGYQVQQDAQGRFLWVMDAGAGSYQFLASRDLREWEPLGRCPATRKAHPVVGGLLLRRPDGSFDLFTREYLRPRGEKGPAGEKPPCLLRHRFATDLQRWPEPKTLLEWPWPGDGLRLAGAWADGHPVVLAHRFSGEHTRGQGTCCARLLVGGADGWRVTDPLPDVVFGQAAMLHHPRWGFVIAWTRPAGRERSTHPGAGPFVLRGQDLESIVTSLKGDAP